MKKKVIISIILLLIIFSAFTLIKFNNKEGNIKNTKIIIGKSNIYSREELNSAINIVLSKFSEFPATLNKIYYDEEKSQKESDEWAEQYNADEAIILYSTFKTYKGKKALDSGFNENTKYSDWNWILVRSNHGDWKLKTWGY